MKCFHQGKSKGEVPLLRRVFWRLRRSSGRRRRLLLKSVPPSAPSGFASRKFASWAQDKDRHFRIPGAPVLTTPVPAGKDRGQQR